MVTFFVVVMDVVLLCTGNWCVPVDMSFLQKALVFGTVELFAEIVGYVRIYKTKEKKDE